MEHFLKIGPGDFKTLILFKPSPLLALFHLEYQMSHSMRFPTMWYVRPAKPQISLR